ncbi:MAG: ATP-binding protein, partial [Ktedonobacteraceae bacterium]|nr:ATP-binding protein [Ktedonobacteraceae bacterium]
IHCVIDHHLPHAWADPDRVQQVLTNLIENAIKYSPQGGLVEIIARARRTMHQLSLQPLDDQSTTTHWKTYITVRDWGIGIPPQMQSSLFKPFKRLEHPLTMHVAGNGLGLYITRQLVEAMGGQIMLTSSEGKGTSVTITLPADSGTQEQPRQDASLTAPIEPYSRAQHGSHHPNP